MARPSTLPRWAETAGGAPAANIVEPTEGKKDTGYTTGGDIPTSGGFNWLFRTIYAWLLHFAQEAVSWPAKHAFSAGLSSAVAPSAASDVARKAEVDAVAPAMRAAASTWSARQTFDGGATVPHPPVNTTDPATKGYVDGLNTWPTMQHLQGGFDAAAPSSVSIGSVALAAFFSESTAASGTGIRGEGEFAGVSGVKRGTGAGAGVYAQGSGAGQGVMAVGGGTSSAPTSAPLNLVPGDVDPSSPAEGDVWISGTNGNKYLRVRLAGQNRNIVGPF